MHCILVSSTRAALAGALVIAGLALAGCSGPNHPEEVANSTVNSFRNTVKGHAESSDGLVQFRALGPIDVVVDSVGGDVEIIGNPKIAVTTVQVVREAQHGYLRGNDPLDAIRMIDWNAELTPGPGPLETLRVSSSYDGPEPWFIRTHVRIETPDLANVNVQTVRGSVDIVNNTGGVDVRTDDGSILVASMHPLRGESTIIGSGGDIDYRVPRGSTGFFDVEVVDGEIQTRITEGLWRYVDKANTADMVNATLNAGTNPVIIRTTEGDIRISVVRNPLGYGPVRTGA